MPMARIGTSDLDVFPLATDSACWRLIATFAPLALAVSTSLLRPSKPAYARRGAGRVAIGRARRSRGVAIRFSKHVEGPPSESEANGHDHDDTGKHGETAKHEPHEGHPIQSDRRNVIAYLMTLQ